MSEHIYSTSHRFVDSVEVTESVPGCSQRGIGPESINRCCPVTDLKGRGRGARCWADPRTTGPADSPVMCIRLGSRQSSSGTQSRRWRNSTFLFLFPLQTWQQHDCWSVALTVVKDVEFGTKPCQNSSRQSGVSRMNKNYSGLCHFALCSNPTAVS